MVQTIKPLYPDRLRTRRLRSQTIYPQTLYHSISGLSNLQTIVYDCISMYSIYGITISSLFPAVFAGTKGVIMIIWVPVTFQRCIKIKVNIDMISNLTGTLLRTIWRFWRACCIQSLSGLSNHSSLHSTKLRGNIKKITNLYIISPMVVLVDVPPIIAHAAVVILQVAPTANKRGHKKITNITHYSPYI